MIISNDFQERDYEYSRGLDIHRYSNNPEVTNFINKMYEKHFKTYFNNNSQTQVNHRVRIQHLKLVLLDLYVAWSADPELHLAVHMSKNSYSNGKVSIRGKSRYNELNIKVMLIQTVNRLRELGFIGFKKSWTDAKGKSFLSRIWADQKLILLFEKVLFDPLDVSNKSDREVIIFKTDKKKDIEYTDTDQIVSMRKLIQDYNTQIERTFIDIPGCESPEVVISSKQGDKTNKSVKVSITQDNKFVRKIFNNNWNEGSIFVGGWWQRINQDIRKKIYINNEPTIEIDYSTLPIVLAYAENNIDYWVTNSEDPYKAVELPKIDASEANVKEIAPDDARVIVKNLLLVSMNAKNETAAFQAFNSNWDYKKYPYRGVFKHQYLKQLLDNIIKAHPKITDLIFSGKGNRLINKEVQIVDYIVKQFVRGDKPILIVHDSLVVQESYTCDVYEFMNEAINKVIKMNNSEMKFKYDINKKDIKNAANLFLDIGIKNLRDSTPKTDSKNMSVGYDMRWKKHKKYFYKEDLND